MDDKRQGSGDGWQEYYRLRDQIEAAKANELRRLNEWCEDLSRGQGEIKDQVGGIQVGLARLEVQVKTATGFYSGLAALLVAVATALWTLLQKGPG